MDPKSLRVARFSSTLWLLSTIWTAALCAHAALPPEAREFIEHLFSEYRDGNPPPPVLGDQAPDIFTPELLNLIRADQNQAHGDAGALDYDPICGCQDFQNLKLTHLTCNAVGPGRARVTVRLLNARQTKTIQFSLLLERGRWLIADIEDAETGSLKKFLERALKTSRPAQPE
jgi:hypothetical protein